MIAKRIKPGLLEIYNKPSSGEIESYSLLIISKEDALALIYAANNITKTSEDTIAITYRDDELVAKMFKAIAQKHKQDNPNFMDVSKRFDVEPDIQPGTSALVREKGLIKVVYRKTTGSKENFINKVFIPNEVRNSFFKDVTEKSRYYIETGKFAVKEEDRALYTKWSEYMNKQYFNLLAKVKSAKS